MSPPLHAFEFPALLLLDLQADFLQPTGRFPIEDAQTPGLLAAVNGAIHAAVSAQWPILHVANAFPRLDPRNLFRRFCAISGTPGAQVDPRIVRPPAWTEFQKTTGDAFTNPGLDDHLRQAGVRHLLIAGVYAEACVTATAIGALGRGYRVSLVAGGVGGRSQTTVRRAVGRLASKGVDERSLDDALAGPDRKRSGEAGDRAVAPALPH